MTELLNNKIAIVGAGLMGTGIAHAFTTSGFKTLLIDSSETALNKAQSNIEDIIKTGVRLGKLTELQGANGLKNLSTSTDLVSAAKGASLLLETISENLELKQKIIRDAEGVLAKNAIIATNTSALSITEIATASQNTETVIGMHFFNPVHKMTLVEIVVGLSTNAETLAKTRAYSDAIGKTSIVVNETPGLTTSRMAAMAGNEAMYMLQEGAATAEDIDTALRLGFNYPMGPLELGDLTGWDTRLSVLQYLHRTLGEKFRPCPLIIKMVASGRVGRKVGHGVYKYEDGKKVPHSGLKGSAI